MENKNWMWKKNSLMEKNIERGKKEMVCGFKKNSGEKWGLLLENQTNGRKMGLVGGTWLKGDEGWLMEN